MRTFYLQKVHLITYCFLYIFLSFLDLWTFFDKKIKNNKKEINL